MELILGSRNLIADIATALDVAGNEHLVLVVKGTWQIPAPGQRAQPIAPAPLALSDVYLGTEGHSPMLYGADFARCKPFCDVLFHASAHSPDGMPVRMLTAGWQVAGLQKVVRVHGQRYWQVQQGQQRLSQAEAFTQMPLHFGFAFGGTRTYQPDSQTRLTESLLDNPDGIGWVGAHSLDQLHGLPAPSLEALEAPITQANGNYTPMAFSAIGRHWPARKQFAGTYDADWQREVAPLLPIDFDERYHQCAPLDQQMPYPQGGESVRLYHMMAGRPDVQFTLPLFNNMQIRILRTDYSTEEPQAVVDTLYFEPDAQRFSAIWRVSLPIRRRLQEFDTIAIGPVDSAWWQHKRMGMQTDCSNCAEPIRRD